MALLSEVEKNYGRLKLFIDGRWADSRSPRVEPVMNPAKDEVIAEVPFTLKEEVDAAVQAAAGAFEKWKELPIPTRVQYLYRLKQKLEEHFEELSRVTTQNHGKIIDESRGEMRRLIENVESACAVAYTLAKGEHMDLIAPGIDETLIREPLGVFAILGPFNFPSLASFWFIPYAMALGCTLVVKPSEICPLPMQRTFVAMEEVSVPRGVLNLVHGGREASEALITHRDVKGVAFVGSTAAGKSVYKVAGEHGKRALVQAGAKNFLVVMPDADLDAIMPALMASFYGNTGQRCLSGANLVAVGDVYESLKNKFVEASSKLRLGYGLDESTEMGPVVTSKAKERILGYIEKGASEGARLVLDGRGAKVEEYPSGYFLGATVFDDVTTDMTIANEEIFGPVACVMRAKDLDCAIEMINGSRYGNAACIFTADGKSVREFRRKANVGNVGINIGIPAPMGFFPFGGWKESFFGVLHGQMDCVDFFTDKKIVIARWR